MAGEVIACFGEIMLRLSPPGRELLLQTPRFEVNVGGAEANVAIGLASLGHTVRMISAVPDNPLGSAAVAELRRRNVDTSAVVMAKGRLGIYFMTPGAGHRAAEVLYDREDSIFSRRRADEWDWDAALAGATRLHLSGISPALGPGASAAALAAAKAAVAHDIPVSFDCNYREKLWESWDSNPRRTLMELVGHADVLFGNHRDVSLLLDWRSTGAGPERRRAAAEAAFAAFPRLQVVASTARRVVDADRHRISARVDTRNSAHQTADVAVNGIVDRIGAGDAFAAGVLHGLAESGLNPGEAASAGLALAVLKHSLPGDASLFTRADLAAFTAGNLDVRR